MDVHSYMADWAVNYFKNRDSFTKKIVSIEKNKNGYDVHIKFKDKEQSVIVSNHLDLQSILPKLNNDSIFYIITLNSSENFKKLIEHWKDLIKFKFLSIIFANPFSSQDKRWIIMPHTHHRICDEASLELGLKSMFDMVDRTSEEELKSKH